MYTKKVISAMKYAYLLLITVAMKEG